MTNRTSIGPATDPSRGRGSKLGRGIVEVKRAYWSVVGGSIDFSPQPLGRHVDPSGVAGYYCDLRGKTGFTVDDMQRNGYDWVIPMAQAGLGYWELHLEGEDTRREFLRVADWLLDAASESAGGIAWRANFPVAKYELEPGWTSAMAQGQAISVLLRAHLLSGREDYREAAGLALAPMKLPTDRGGTLSLIGDIPILEEYPTPEPSAVLNGWLFALFGLHELATVTEDVETKQLFERSSKGLVELLPRYDIGWWSLYSLYDHGSPDLAKPFYQRLHPVLLDGLRLITAAPELAAFAQRWRDQDTRAGVARTSLNKVRFRLARGFR